MRCVLYDATGHDRDVDPSSVDVENLGAEQLLWIDGTSESISSIVDLSPALHEAAELNNCSVGVDVREHFYQFALPHSVSSSGGGNNTICFRVGSTWLLTMADPRPAFMDRFVDGGRGETLNGQLSASGLVVAIILEYFVDIRNEVANIEKAVDKLDEDILRVREKRAPLKTLAVLRRRASYLRVNLSEIANVVHSLNRPDFLPHIDESDVRHFKQLRYNFDRMEDTVARVRETIVSSFDLYDTRMSQDTNQLIKALTMVTVITGIVCAVAGIFGMNFDIPLEHTGVLGFSIVTVIMIVSAMLLLTVAIWRKWL